jgi:hypothetical protein
MIKIFGFPPKIKADLDIISLKINLFSPWYSLKIAELVLNNNHSLNSPLVKSILLVLFLFVCSMVFNATFNTRITDSLQLPMQSVPITTDVVSSNLDQGEVYNIM